MTAASIAVFVDERIEPVVFSKHDYMHESNFGILREIKSNGIEV